MDTLAIAEHVLAALSVPATAAAAYFFRHFKLYHAARGHIENLQRSLSRAMDEAKAKSDALDVVNTQRANALERARASNVARAAERRAKQVASDAESRAKTIGALAKANLRPRDEVVADVIRSRTGV